MKTRMFICGIGCLVLLAASAAMAETPRQTYENARYLECGMGDAAGALALYEQTAQAAAADAGLAQAARWRAALCLDRLGRRTEAAERLVEVLRAAAAPAPGEAAVIREKAARELLRLTAEETAARSELAPQAAVWLAQVEESRPGLAERLAAERAALRRTLRGTVETWDGRRPVRASVRIRARPATPGVVEARSTWRTQTDDEGRFAIDLPVGRYEVRVWAPAYDRAYASAELTPDEETPPEIRRVLPRIRLPARIDQVELMGDFLDDWEGTAPLERTGEGIWEIRRHLGPGSYEYKFRINGSSHLVTDVAAGTFAADSREDFNARLDLDREQDVVFRFDENDPHFERESAHRPPDPAE